MVCTVAFSTPISKKTAEQMAVVCFIVFVGRETAPAISVTDVSTAFITAIDAYMEQKMAVPVGNVAKTDAKERF